MRVLYVCWLDPATTDVPLFLADAWKSAGHYVHLFPPDLELSNRASLRVGDLLALNDSRLKSLVMERRIDERCNAFRPDVLLFGHPFVTPAGMERLRDKHACIVGYFIGYNNLLERQAAASIRTADFLIVHDSYLIPLVQGSRYGRVPHVFFLNCFATPEEHHPLELSAMDKQDYGADVVFIGGVGPDRIEALQCLIQHNLHIWGGKEWSQVPDLARFYRNEPVYGLKKTKVYNAAKIVLNIEDSEKQVSAVSNRVPEVLACGGFVITQKRQDLDQTLLVDGESIVTYCSLDELSEKVDYYLQNSEQRRRISQNGRRIVLESLTNSHIGVPLIQQIEALVRANRKQHT